MLVREQHLLNIKDLDLSGHLEALANAGVSSFKIEGRLKDADYVKNVVSQLRRRLDDLLGRRPELGRASLGTVNAAFTPDPTKTFQRGHSTYRIDGERQSMGNLESGKHLGAFIGEVRSIQGDRLVLDATTDLHPGDGLAFMDGVEVTGTVINAVEPRQLVVQEPSRIRPGTRLHRNLDLHWLRALRSAKVDRRIPVRASLDFPEGAVRLRLEDPTGFVAEAQASGDFAPPRDEAASTKAIHEALGRLGNTPFELEGLHTAETRFVPVSILNGLRRDTAAALEALRRAPREREGRLLRDLEANGTEPCRNLLRLLLPAPLVPIFCASLGLDPAAPATQLKGPRRNALLGLLKELRVEVTGHGGWEEAIVTAGGIALKDIDPRTLASRKVAGLYFAGELLDLDANTGGYNLQIAFSTGWLAGESAARKALTAVNSAAGTGRIFACE